MNSIQVATTSSFPTSHFLPTLPSQSCNVNGSSTCSRPDPMRLAHRNAIVRLSGWRTEGKTAHGVTLHGVIQLHGCFSTPLGQTSWASLISMHQKLIYTAFNGCLCCIGQTHSPWHATHPCKCTFNSKSFLLSPHLEKNRTTGTTLLPLGESTTIPDPCF